MGSLCHEVAKLQADRAQLEELLAQVSHLLASSWVSIPWFKNNLAQNTRRHSYVRSICTNLMSRRDGHDADAH